MTISLNTQASLGNLGLLYKLFWLNLKEFLKCLHMASFSHKEREVYRERPRCQDVKLILSQEQNLMSSVTHYNYSIILLSFLHHNYETTT